MSSLSERVDRALVLAMELHRTQLRKGSAVPYASHLWAVAGMVAEMGGDEDQVIAALLHDAVEDQGGAATLDRIRREFGDRCAFIVQGCTDTDLVPKPPWRRRKETYLAHLETADASILPVSLADKIHNARSLWRDLRLRGPAAFDVFTGKKEGTLWYYESLAAIFRHRQPGIWTDELVELVARIKTLSDTASTPGASE